MRSTSFRNRIYGRGFPLRMAFVAAGVAFIVTTLMTKIYRSQASLYFPMGSDTTSGLLSALGGLSKSAGLSDKSSQIPLMGSLLQSPEIGSGPQTAIAMLSSVRARQRVIQALDLTARWHMKQGEAIKHLDDITDFALDKNGLLAMEADEPDPHRAAEILNAYIDVLKGFAKELSLNVADRNKELIHKRLLDARRRLDRLQREAEAFAKKDIHALIVTKGEDEAAKAVYKVDEDLLAVQAKLDAVTAELALATRTMMTAVRQAPELPEDAPLAQAARQKLRDAEREFALIQIQYGPESPQYHIAFQKRQQAQSNLTKEIQRANDAFKQGLTPNVLALHSQKVSLDAEQNGLEKALGELESELAKVPQTQLEIDRLEGEKKIAGDLVGFLEMQYETSLIASDRDGSVFEIVDPPDVEEKPYAPRRLLTTGLAFLAGLLLGFAWRMGLKTMEQPPIEEARVLVEKE